MSEGQDFESEGNGSRLSRIKDALGSKSWAKEVASQFDSTVEQIGDITESLGIKPVFLEETAKQELLEHWQQNGGSEVGGYVIGTEGDYDGHKYLHVTKIILDSGSGSQGEFHFVT